MSIIFTQFPVYNVLSTLYWNALWNLTKNYFRLVEDNAPTAQQEKQHGKYTITLQ